MKDLSEAESKEMQKTWLKMYESISAEEEAIPLSQEVPFSFYMQ